MLGSSLTPRGSCILIGISVWVIVVGASNSSNSSVFIAVVDAINVSNSCWTKVENSGSAINCCGLLTSMKCVIGSVVVTHLSVGAEL